MRLLKSFENFNEKFINVALDVSGSITKKHIDAAINYLTDFGEYDKINFIQFSVYVSKFDVINDVDEIYSRLRLEGWNTKINPLIDFIIDNNLNDYKTFIISDFYISDKPDYSKLKDYELVKIPDNIESVFNIPKDIKGKMRKDIIKYNL